MLCWGCLQASRQHMSQVSIKPGYYYSIVVAHIPSLHDDMRHHSRSQIEMIMKGSTSGATLVSRIRTTQYRSGNLS